MKSFAGLQYLIFGKLNIATLISIVYIMFNLLKNIISIYF